MCGATQKILFPCAFIVARLNFIPGNCDEGKPSCKTCLRLGLHCDGYGYTVRYKFTEPIVLEQRAVPSFDTIEWAPVALPCIDASPSDSASTQGEESIFLLEEDGIPCSQSRNSSIGQQDALSWDGMAEFQNPHRGLSPNIPSGHLDDFSKDHVVNSHQADRTLTINHATINLTSDPDTVEQFYFAQWTTCVTPILPPVFSELTVFMPSFLPFKYAVLAVSASHLAHVESSILSSNNGGRGSMYIPDRNHRCRSLQYYGRGIRELAQYVDSFSNKTLCYLVATSLLFHYIEMDSGSLAGAVEHIESINRLHCSAQSQRELGSTRLGQKLLCTWQSLRSLSINKQLTVGSGRIRPLVPIMSNNLASPASDVTTSYDSIAHLLCEAFSTTRTIILDWFVCRGHSLTTADRRDSAFGALLEQISIAEKGNWPQRQLAKIDESYWKTIEKQRASLDDWHSGLDVSDLPVESFTSTSIETVRETDAGLQVEPLRFQTYRAAMNYAYYAAAQLSSSRKTFEQMAELEELASGSRFTREKYPWESLLLRIACGLDMDDCLYKHTFKIGILSFLIICASSCPHIAVAKWTNAWIRELEDHGMAVEDGMPLALIKRIMRLITTMKQNGHDIYRISMVDSDIKEKWEFYRSDNNFMVAICAKDRLRGKLYNDVVYLPS
ncbi:hypothetical protein P175DRAFT_0532065 [Aspergillus ochraceoroseus IBT 24754]|uniref:Zn(2)-C6 fungal-type domain-containing protein n=1 Tax=Aspergillus ochraceoroseus IBT 24754 TaxID=1392256 RepID=A0A2T5LWQ8_9EURO|nr:uncharacterized protein P175DRAFT_0532065 [Aspergillus ochraceoroseus IBT 24754]PTU20717.1 hypothetical protein P175DRAFT_0532065 [Aspergillus ochraceoroseus IBT 24754]